MNRKSILIALVVCSFALTAVVAQATPIPLAAAPVSASSEHSTGLFPATGAFDGVLSAASPNRWASDVIPAWIRVDLGADYNLNTVKISWEAANGTDYTLRTRTSSQGSSTIPGDYTQIASVVGRTNFGTTSLAWDETFDFTSGSVTFHKLSATSSAASTGAMGRYLMLNVTTAYAVTVASPVEIQVDGTVVPEPSTLVLLAAGLIGLLCYAWRKRR